MPIAEYKNPLVESVGKSKYPWGWESIGQRAETKVNGVTVSVAWGGKQRYSLSMSDDRVASVMSGGLNSDKLDLIAQIADSVIELLERVEQDFTTTKYTLSVDPSSVGPITGIITTPHNELIHAVTECIISNARFERAISPKGD